MYFTYCTLYCEICCVRVSLSVYVETVVCAWRWEEGLCVAGWWLCAVT